MRKNLFVIFAFFALALLFQPIQNFAQKQKIPVENYIKNKDTLPPHPTYFRYCSSDPGALSYDSTRRGFPIVEDWPQNADRSNLSMINMNPDSSYNFRFSYKDFVPGQDASTTWQAWVQDLTKNARLVVTFTDRAGNDSTIDVRYNAFMVTIRPNLDFGLLSKGDSVKKDVWLVNENPLYPSIIINLDLKLRNQGFDLLNVSLPLTVPPKDSIKITIRFIATQDGDFIDSTGAGDSCWFYFRNQMKAKVGVAVIDVSDYDFGYVPVNQPAQGTIHIKNKGTVPLIITGFTHPRLTVFSDELRQITPQFPLILNPGDVYDFLVDFLPKDTIHYIDTMFFMSNSVVMPSTDSIAILNGRGIKSDLEANSYDWGNRLIDIPGFPAGPYDANPGDSIIILKNTGNMQVVIRGIKRVADTNGTAFLFNEQDLTNIIINPGDQLYVPVQFHPTKVGLHKLILEYDNTAASTTQTVLEGFGILPDNVIDNNQNKENFTISPNPASTAFTLKFESANNAKMQFTLFDLLGNPVFSSSEESNIGMNEKVIDCQGLETGYYILRLMQNWDVRTKAVLIIKD
jgi:hypothetical protein